MWQGFLASIGFVVVQMPLGLKLSIVEFRNWRGWAGHGEDSSSFSPAAVAGAKATKAKKELPELAGASPGDIQYLPLFLNGGFLL